MELSKKSPQSREIKTLEILKNIAEDEPNVNDSSCSASSNAD